MDKEAWWATVHGVARVGHNLVTNHCYGCVHMSVGVVKGGTLPAEAYPEVL